MYIYIYIYTNTVLDGSVNLSVILFVRYRNHFPVVQFQNQAHSESSWHGSSFYNHLGHRRRPKFGVLHVPQVLFYIYRRRRRRKLPPQLFIITLLFYRRRRRRFPKWVPKAPPEGKENPAEGGCFASIYVCTYTHIYIFQKLFQFNIIILKITI